MKDFPFKKAVITFCLLNIYIIIAWHDWRYGGSYSCRALVQSYPVFALPLAALVQYIKSRKWRYLFYAIGIYLSLVNIFQLNQYITGIIHYNDMNRRYYGRVYLNVSPDPIDISLLDTDEIIYGESRYENKTLAQLDSTVNFNLPSYHELTILEISSDLRSQQSFAEHWIKVEASIQVDHGMSCSYLYADIITPDSIKQLALRLFSPISEKGVPNAYAGCISVPDELMYFKIRVYIKSCRDFSGKAVQARVLQYYR